MPATKTVRFDHSNCKHAKSGAEGKKARAACRKEHAAKAVKAAAKPNPAKKPVTRTRKPAAPKAAAPKVEAPATEPVPAN